MHCASFQDLLLNYADLPGEERDTVDLHVAGCQGCRGYFDTLQQLDAALADQLSGIQTLPAFRSRVYAGITTRSTLIAPSFLPELLDLIGWAAVLAVALVVLWTEIPMPPTLNFLPVVSRLLPVCTGLALLGAAWIGMRVYSELKS